MDTFSNEEKVSKDFLENGNVDIILNVVDASNLSRNLYLTTQLMKFNKPIIILLNMLDVAESKGINIDIPSLEKGLGISIVPIVAKKKEGLENISRDINLELKKSINYKKDFGNETQTYQEIEKILIKSINIDVKAK